MGKAAVSLQERIRDYFAACDGAEEADAGRGGKSRRLPYTLAGLADHLDMPKGALLSRVKARKPGSEALAAALRRIERDTVERALTGELKSSVAALLLGDLGALGGSADGDDGRVRIVMEDREGWSL